MIVNPSKPMLKHVDMFNGLWKLGLVDPCVSHKRMYSYSISGITKLTDAARENLWLLYNCIAI